MANFADPINLTLAAIVLAVGVHTISQRVARVLIFAAVIFLYFMATPFIANRLLSAVEFVPPAPIHLTPGKPGAIVILGADIRHRSPEFDGDTVGPLSLERVRYAARVYQETHLPMLTTGNKIGDSDKSVARVMAETLEHDFQVSVQWIEEGARNTFENALLSAKMLRAEGIDTVFLVTHSWHMARALEAFRAVGIAAIARPTGATIADSNEAIGLSDVLPHSGALRNSALALHEGIGRYWYRVRYY